MNIKKITNIGRDNKRGIDIKLSNHILMIHKEKQFKYQLKYIE